jgi:hypothetical protein
LSIVHEFSAIPSGVADEIDLDAQAIVLNHGHINSLPRSVLWDSGDSNFEDTDSVTSDQGFDVPIHPSGWRALGKGSRGPNRRILGRIVGSRSESAATAAAGARRSGRVVNGATGRQLISPEDLAWVDDPTLPSEEATVGKNGLGDKTIMAIHPSGWRASGRGSRGPNRRTLGRIVGSREESASTAAAGVRRSGSCDVRGFAQG